MEQIFGMCASISNKNNNYKPGKSFSTQNHLLILWEKNTGKKVVTQGKLREFYLDWNVATLIMLTSILVVDSSEVRFPDQISTGDCYRSYSGAKRSSSQMSSSVRF